MYVITEGFEKLDAKVLRKEQRCIHTDDWATIIHYARTNPWVYRKCVENGCTKSIELRFPAGSKLYNTSTDKYTDAVTTNSDGSHTVKYAVSIYGIRRDKGANGDLIGLTFGPAVGEKYTDGYRCHVESCSRVAGMGDGASVLYDSINPDYRIWNNDSCSQASNGGWPGSRIRATLNGADQYTADGPGVSTGGGKIYYRWEEKKNNAGTDVLQESDALISAFPKELWSAIVPKAVISDTRYNDCSSTNYTFTTYDNLWLFSGAEVWQDAGSGDDSIRPHEGVGGTAIPYDRAVKLGISTGSPLSNGFGSNTGYRESGGVGRWWLRSLNRKVSYSVCSENSADTVYYDSAGRGRSLAPGFCIGL